MTKRKPGNLRVEVVLREHEDAALIPLAEQLLARRDMGEAVRGVLKLALLSAPDGPLERIACALETIAASAGTYSALAVDGKQIAVYAKALGEL